MKVTYSLIEVFASSAYEPPQHLCAGLVGVHPSEEGSAVRDNRQTTKVKQVVLPKRSAVLAILYQAFAKVKQLVLLSRVRRIPSVNGHFERV